MTTATPARSRLSAWAAALLSLLMVASGLTLGAVPANAATGDVAGATLNWGIKESFRTYISGPIASGGWTVSGGVADATPFAWSAGTGASAGTTGTVAYPGSIHFTGHGGALDLTFSNVRIQQTSATAASVILDTATATNVTFATVDLASATSTSAAGTVSYSGAPATLTADGATSFAGFYAAGVALDPVSFSWPVEQAPTPEPELPAVPTVTVSKTTELSPAGETVTVTGTGFSPVAPATTGTRPPLAGQFGGAYVVFGKFADVWKPSAGAPSSSRKVASQQWVVNPENVAALGAAAVAINADGSFTAQLRVSQGFGETATGNYGIYTYSGSGAAYAAFETYTPVTFTTAPTVSVSKTTGLNPLGETVTIKGWNFVPNAPATTGTRPPLAGQFGGAYVVFGKFPDSWKPSAGVPSASRKVGSQVWGMSAASSATIGAGTAVIAADGTFSVELLVKPGYTGEPATGNYGIYTYPGSGATYAPFETYTPVAFTAATATSLALTASAASEGGSTTLAAAVTPAANGTVTFREGSTVLGTAPASAASLTVSSLSAGAHVYTAEFAPEAPLLFTGSTGTVTLDVAAKPVETVAAGSLTWGVKESFRSYVTGQIARGSITTSGAATLGGAFVFGQSAGGTFSASSGTGSANYSGSVRFQGHDGLLDVTLSNPAVVVESASRATLYVSVNGGASREFATLNLAGGVRSTPGNTVAYSGVPAALTAAGASVFSLNGSNFYPAGTALDSVAFAIGTPAAAVSGGVRTIAAFLGDRQPANTPPATEGVTVDPESLKNLVAGGEISITVDGYRPGETGIMIVIYSEPVVLARDLVADAAGRVTWTGRLPAGLTGTHTLTVQGSVNRGVVLDIPANITTAAVGCPVTDATLTWGFKESFRSYISGSIANGRWTLADGAAYDIPNFGWSGGEGAYENGEGLVAFPGAITFTGHGGILNTTIANPQLRFIDDDTAVILLDVSGTTQDGATVNAPAVEFVEIDLAAATIDQTDGTITVTEAPTTLTVAGSEAFGTYEAGEAFDPVSFTLPLDAACGSVLPLATPEAGVDAAPASAETPNLWWVWLIVVLLLAAAATTVIVIRRRNPIA